MHACGWDNTFLKKRIFWAIITWSVAGKQNINLYSLRVKTDECEINFAKLHVFKFNSIKTSLHVNDKLLHVNALDTILTETDIFPNTSSGIGPLSFFINLSRHVVINSIQINTSDYQHNTQIHVNKTPIKLK